MLAKKVESERLILKPLLPGDVTEQYIEWLNDENINQYLESRFSKRSDEEVISYVREMIQSPSDILFGLFLKHTGEHIGNIKIGTINTVHGLADIGLIIGNKNCWGKGFATEAITAASAYGFDSLKLRKLWAGAYICNEGVIKAFLKAGFQKECTLIKQSFYKNGYVDNVILTKFNDKLLK